MEDTREAAGQGEEEMIGGASGASRLTALIPLALGVFAIVATTRMVKNGVMKSGI